LILQENKKYDVAEASSGKTFIHASIKSASFLKTLKEFRQHGGLIHSLVLKWQITTIKIYFGLSTRCVTYIIKEQIPIATAILYSNNMLQPQRFFFRIKYLKTYTNGLYTIVL
jgi:hypothetical protein